MINWLSSFLFFMFGMFVDIEISSKIAFAIKNYWVGISVGFTYFIIAAILIGMISYYLITEGDNN